VHAACLEGREPGIDGHLSDWPPLEPISLEPGGGTAGGWDGPADLSADLLLGYDRDSLYIGATVRDDAWCQRHDGWAIWNGDCLQVAFDPLNARTPDGYGPNTHEIGLTMIDGRPLCLRWYGRRGQVRDQVLSVRLAIRRNEDEGTTVYEAAIPLSELAPLSPEIIPVAGFAVVVHDADGADRESYLEMPPGSLAAGKHPDRFSSLRFDPPAPDDRMTGAWAALVWNDTVMPVGGTIDTDVYSVFRDAPEGSIEVEVAPAGPTKGVPGKGSSGFPVSDSPVVRVLHISPGGPAGEYRLRVRALGATGYVIFDETAPLYVFPR